MLRKMRFLCWFSWVLWFGAVVAQDDGNWPQEQQRIADLMLCLQQQNAVFIRNGSEYQADEAVQHLQRKLNNALRSWFAPPKRKWTAELFIDKLATESSMSGKPYQIRFSNGERVESGPWLHQQLSGCHSAQKASGQVDIPHGGEP